MICILQRCFFLKIIDFARAYEWILGNHIVFITIGMIFESNTGYSSQLGMSKKNDHNHCTFLSRQAQARHVRHSIGPVTGSLFDAKSRSKDSRDKSCGYRKRGISFCGTCHFEGSIVAMGHGSNAQSCCAEIWLSFSKVTFWDTKSR